MDLDPLDLIHRICAQIPAPRQHLVRYYGWYGNRARGARKTHGSGAPHVPILTRDALRNMDRTVAGAEVLLCGASYRQDVGDTRYSGSEVVVRRLTEMGAELRVHDPYVERWWEFEAQESYPATGQSLSRFFRNQDQLNDLHVEQNSGPR